jgi:hypothetical protein
LTPDEQAEVDVQVLWWLVPPLVATAIAMAWAGWAGRERDEVRRDNSEAALLRMQRALNRPAPSSAAVSAPPLEPTHGVAVRRTRRPATASASRR